VICIPYEYAFKSSVKSSTNRFFESSKNLELKSNLNLELKILEEEILNKNYSKGSEISKEVSSRAGNPIDSIVETLKRALELKLDDEHTLFDSHAQNFLTLAYTLKLGSSGENGSKKSGISVNSATLAFR